MTVRFEGKINSASMNRVRNAIANTPKRIYPKLQAEFSRWGREWERAVQDRFTGSTGQSSLHGRTGQLQKSMSSKIDGGTIAELHLRCQSAGVNYARQREYGGEIKPVNRKFLTIPTDANKSAAGVARYPTVASLISAFGRDRVFTLARDGKAPFIAVKGVRLAGGKTNRLDKKSGLSVTPMFWLTRKVDQPGPRSPSHKQASRLGFFDEWAKLGDDRRRGLARLGRELKRAI